MQAKAQFPQHQQRQVSRRGIGVVRGELLERLRRLGELVAGEAASPVIFSSAWRWRSGRGSPARLLV